MVRFCRLVLGLVIGFRDPAIAQIMPDSDLAYGEAIANKMLELSMKKICFSEKILAWTHQVVV